jgi:hypothetical protein
MEMRKEEIVESRRVFDRKLKENNKKNDSEFEREKDGLKETEKQIYVEKICDGELKKKSKLDFCKLNEIEVVTDNKEEFMEKKAKMCIAHFGTNSKKMEAESSSEKVKKTSIVGNMKEKSHLEEENYTLDKATGNEISTNELEKMKRKRESSALTHKPIGGNRAKKIDESSGENQSCKNVVDRVYHTQENIHEEVGNVHKNKKKGKKTRVIKDDIESQRPEDLKIDEKKARLENEKALKVEKDSSVSSKDIQLDGILEANIEDLDPVDKKFQEIVTSSPPTLCFDEAPTDEFLNFTLDALKKQLLFDVSQHSSRVCEILSDAAEKIRKEQEKLLENGFTFKFYFILF